MGRCPTKITNNERRVVRAIMAHWSAFGYAPTVRELVASMWYSSTNTISCFLAQLARKRLITYQPKLSRTICATPYGRAHAVDKRTGFQYAAAAWLQRKEKNNGK